MPFYNRILASAYAAAWGLSRNPKWPDYDGPSHGGGDCTNFVSQALFAGGWEMVFGPRISGLPWFAWPDDRKNRSKSWAAADWFSDFLATSLRARKCDFSELTLGDLIQEQLDGYGVRHTMIITDVKSGRLFLTYHSANYLNTGFEDVQKRAGTDASFIYWKLFDVYVNPYSTGSASIYSGRDRWDYQRLPKPAMMW